MSRAALAAWGAAFAFSAACGAAQPEPAPAYGGPPDPEDYSEPGPALEEGDAEDDEQLDTSGDDAFTPDGDPPPADDQGEALPAPAYGGPPPS